MKKTTVLTVAFAAAMMTFAAHSAESAEANKKEPAAKAEQATKGKQTAGTGVMRENCPYVFGCGDAEGSKSDPTKTASIKPVKPKASDVPGSEYEHIIAKYSAAYGVPARLARAVIHVESSFRPNVRGSAGEIGLMQIKPATARMMGYSGSAQGLFDPDTNIKFGIKYLSKAHELSGGTTCGTILRYNAGHAAKRMNKRSSAYCAKVKRLLAGA